MTTPLSKLSPEGLLAFGERSDLTPEMKRLLLAELKARRVSKKAKVAAPLDAYYADTVGGSVLSDYQSGNIQIIEVLS